MPEKYISYNSRVRYVSIPKCACTSIKHALLKADGIDIPNGIETHKHPHWMKWDSTFRPDMVFTFVRHPGSRMLSAWREKVTTGYSQKMGCPLPTTASPMEFITWITTQDPRTLNIHFKPQHLILEGYKEKPAIRFIGKVESIQTDWRFLSEHFHLPILQRSNESGAVRMPSIPGAFFHTAYDYYKQDYLDFGYDKLMPPSEPAPIPGWLFPKEELELAELAKDKKVLEIGTWMGKSAGAMARTAKAVYCVDHFRGDADTAELSRDNWVLPKALDNFHAHGLKNVYLHVGPLEEVLRQLNLKNYDMFYYDADHSANVTGLTLDYILTNCAKKSIVTVHDYGKQKFVDATKAIDELASKHNRSIRVVGSLAVLEPRRRVKA